MRWQVPAVVRGVTGNPAESCEPASATAPAAPLRAACFRKLGLPAREGIGTAMSRWNRGCMQQLACTASCSNELCEATGMAPGARVAQNNHNALWEIFQAAAQSSDGVTAGRMGGSEAHQRLEYHGISTRAA